VPIPEGKPGGCSKASGVAAFLALAVIVAVSLPPVPTAAVQNGATTGSISAVVRLSAPARRLNTTGAYPSRRVAVAPQRAASELENVVVFVRRPPATSKSGS